MEQAVMCAAVVLFVFQYRVDRVSGVFVVEGIVYERCEQAVFQTETGYKRNANATVSTRPPLTSSGRTLRHLPKQTRSLEMSA
jgi:hypothetical protein